MSLHKYDSMIFVLGRMGYVCLYDVVTQKPQLSSCFCTCITTAIIFEK